MLPLKKITSPIVIRTSRWRLLVLDHDVLEIVFGVITNLSDTSVSSLERKLPRLQPRLGLSEHSLIQLTTAVVLHILINNNLHLFTPLNLLIQILGHTLG